jgi:hypothetical protein
LSIVLARECLRPMSWKSKETFGRTAWHGQETVPQGVPEFKAFPSVSSVGVTGANQ